MKKVPLLSGALIGSMFIFGSCSGADFKDEMYLVGGFSGLPNIGLTMGGGQVFSSEANGDAKAVELIGTWQPIDDEFFANDGNPAAEDWSQVSLGINQYNLEERRRWHLRYGVVWARAEGEPNMVQLPGDYNRVYAAYGFSTEYKEGWRIGPELQLNAIGMEGGKDSKSVWFVPQLLFRAVWVF